MRFAYLKDPLFLFCLTTYFVNRFVMKPYFPNRFSSDYLNDLICLPFWIPIMLWFARRIGLRRTDEPPRRHELLIPLVLWSWVFEVYLPKTKTFEHLATADYLDIFCYALGGLIATVFWTHWYREPQSANNGNDAAI